MMNDVKLFEFFFSFMYVCVFSPLFSSHETFCFCFVFKKKTILVLENVWQRGPVS